MSALRDLQVRFAEALFSNGASPVEDHVAGKGLGAARRIRVYRNNVYAGLTEALAALYPVVERLVGDGFFRYAARRYIGAWPSQSGNLHGFGRHYPAFIEALPAARGLPYLGDVARLEWLYHEAYHAPFAAGGFDWDGLREVPEARRGALRFAVHPSGRLLASPFPILRIWASNQPGYEGDGNVAMSEAGVRILVFRPGLDVEFHPLEPGEYAFIEALAAGLDITEASALATEQDPRFDLAAVLGRSIALGVLTRWHLVPPGRSQHPEP